MVVYKYIPTKLYGFVTDEHGTQAFFHLKDFDPQSWQVPPVLGEVVEVDVNLTEVSPFLMKRAPKAQKVTRTQSPEQKIGFVDSFDQSRGYGFLKDEEGRFYHLHKSEIIGNRYPIIGQKAIFYVGSRQNRPRACHVQLINEF